MALDGAHRLGKNFAPVEPLADAKRLIKKPNENASSINAFFRDQYDQIKNEYQQAREQVIEQARVIQNMRAGKLVMKNDMNGGRPLFFKPIPGAVDRSNFPVFPVNSETLKSKWMSAKPLMQAEAYGDGFRVEQAIHGMNLVVKHYFRRIFDGAETLYEADEALSAQDYGTYITQLYYDDRLNQIRQAIPLIQNESRVMVPGFGGCLSCGYQGHPDDFAKSGAPYPQCPECEAFRTTKMVPDAVSEVPTVVGMDEIVQGDINGRLLNWAGSYYDYHVYAHQSDYFMYSEYIPLRLATSMFGQDLDLQESESDDIGLQLADALAARGGNIEGQGENDHFSAGSMLKGRVPMHTMWLKPERYAGFKLEKAEKTLGGTIPADVPFEEIWPNGLAVSAFEDFKLQVGLFGEKANIASACYLTMSGSGVGKALSDGVDIAKDMTEMHSMAMAGLKRMGATGLVVDSSSGVTQEQVRNMLRPGKAVMVDMKEAGIDDVRKAVTQLQLNPMNPVLPQYAVQMTNLLNMVMMTGEFAQGMVQDVDINTLGGQQLAHAKAEEQKGGILTGKVFHRKQSAKIICELFREHIKIPKWYSLSSDTQGSSKGKYISGADLPKELDFVAVQDSEVPVNQAEKKMATRELIEKSGGIGPLIQAAQMAPKETAWFMSQYGISLPTLDTNQMQLVCLSRLDEIKELGNVYPDPQQILMSLRKKVKIDEPLHILKAEFISSMLDDDEADEWAPNVLEAVQLLVDLHYDYEAEAALKKAMIAQNAEMRLQETMAERARAMAQPEIDAEREQGEQDQVVQFLGDAAGRVMDENAAEAQHERDMERDDADGERKIGIEQEKAKLKPAPASAAKK